MLLLGLEVVVGVAATTGCSYLWYTMTNLLVDLEVNRWLSEASATSRADALTVKQEFSRAEARTAALVANHTHAASAAERSSASLLMRVIAEGIGRRPYFFQGSGSDARAGRAYSRTYFWAKDLMAPYQEFAPEPTDVISMVDVDYYVDDLEEMMVERFQPYLLYTLVPSSAGKDSGDYDYRFLQDGRVEYGVSGGGRYCHHIWNWDGDSLRIMTKFMGFNVAMACYYVERRQMGPDHQLVLLLPSVRTYNPFWIWLAKNRVAARKLARFNPISGKFVRFYASKPQGLDVVTGIVDDYASSTVPASVDAIISSTARTISGKLTRQTVLSKLDVELEGRTISRVASEILLEFHLTGAPTKERISLVDSVRRFQWIPREADYDEDAKAGMTAFMKPLVHGAFVPDICKNNEERMVNKRVKEQTSKELPASKFMLDTMDEFIGLLIPDDMAHTLHPVDVEEVYKRQNRPSQRAILAEAEHTQSTGVTRQFVKREAYGRVNDPRGISTICGPDKMEFSQFMYAFVDLVLKHQEWYAFGKTPEEVARRVAEVAEGAQVNGANKDFKRMDGKHSNVLHLFERKVYTRAYRREYHNRLVAAMDKHHHLKARTTFGITYRTEWHRLSGGADTSAGNTLDTAFIAFLTYRIQGLSALEAWRKLGIYAGDDGFDADCIPKVAAKAAASVGQVLDIKVVKIGEPGVSFLARRYGPDVWYGDKNSCCDIRRQVAKFHTTVNLPGKVSKEQKLQEKAFSFALTDKHTPIIGEFVTRALEIFPLKSTEFKNELRIWGVEMDANKQYPNEPAAWMDDIVAAELSDFDLSRFREWLRQADGGSILDPPQFAEQLPADPQPGMFALDGDIHGKRDVGPAKQPARCDKGKSDGKAHFRARKPKEERNSRKLSPPKKQK